MLKILTDRDIELMKDLFRLRVLTTDQIYRLYFHNTSKGYCYQRLHKLRKKGLITSKSIFYDGERKVAVYSLTDMGIRELVKQGELDTYVQAKDIRPKASQRAYIIQINDLYCILAQKGWKLIDSREIKEKFGIHRGNTVQGALIDLDENMTGIFIIMNDPKEETIIKVAKDIPQSKIPNVMVLCKDLNGFERFFQYISNNFIVANSIKVMPYKLAERLLYTFPSEQAFINHFTRWGKIEPIHSKLGFEYTIEMNGRKHYFVEMLRFDIMLLDSLKRYTPDRYQMDGTGVKLFAWSIYAEKIKELFKKYPHISIIELEISDVFSNYKELQTIATGV